MKPTALARGIFTGYQKSLSTTHISEVSKVRQNILTIIYVQRHLLLYVFTASCWGRNQFAVSQKS